MVFITAVAIVEGILLLGSNPSSRPVISQAEKALSGFFSRSQSIPDAGNGTHLRLNNVQFCWTNTLCVLTTRMNGIAIPLDGDVILTDEPGSFVVQVGEAGVNLLPQVFQAMLNEGVFHYSGSRLKDLKLAIIRQNGENLLRLQGGIHVVFWLPFELKARMGVDRTVNALDLEVIDIKALGFIPAMDLIRWQPFELEKLLSVPKEQPVTIKNNHIKIEPQALFPPPRIQGTIESVLLKPTGVRLLFRENTAVDSFQFPAGAGGNGITLLGGNVKFGSLTMSDTRIRLSDTSPTTPFRFNLKRYSESLHQSRLQIRQDGSLTIAMPDSP
jgi:hypothetical protein